MKPIRLTALVVAAAALTSCANEDIKDTLGLTRKAPDEFQVYSRPPLTLPPEFELRPPAKGNDVIAGTPTTDIAHKEILSTSSGLTQNPAPLAASGGQPVMHFLNAPNAAAPGAAVSPVTSSELPDASDAQFLSKAGAGNIDPNVRDAIEQDKVKGIKPKDNTYLFGGKKDTDPEVDATREADRLKADKAQNKPPTEGDTPVVAPKDNGLFGNLF